MASADSLLQAAKKVAEVTGYDWSDLQPYYRALQEPTGADSTAWLPKSVGRNVWQAHPHFITALLIAFAAADHPSKSNAAVDWVYETTPNGRKRYLEEEPAAGVHAPIVREIVRYLVDPTAASDLDNIEFQTDRHQVVFHMHDGSQKVFSRPLSLRKDLPVPPAKFRSVYRNGNISALALSGVAKAITWRTPDQAPFNVGDELDD